MPIYYLLPSTDTKGRIECDFDLSFTYVVRPSDGKKLVSLGYGTYERPVKP